MKTCFRKQPPKIISYIDYKHFSQPYFQYELEIALIQHNFLFIPNDKFVEITVELFNKHVPLKHKYIRANQSPFMTKVLQKAIMHRPKLRNRANRTKSEADLLEYKKQRNLCTFLLRKAKKDYFSKLNPSKIADNKNFWKIVKPLFSCKSATTESITIVENNNIFQEDKKVAEIFNEFFSNVVNNLNIEIDKEILVEDLNEVYPIRIAIKKYSKHPSIVKINAAPGNIIGEKFSFCHTTIDNIYNEIKALNSLKSSPKDSIPSKIINVNCDIFGEKLFTDFDPGLFPSNLKYADVTPVYKKGERVDKNNYRPISLLPALSKIFEKLLYYQITIRIRIRIRIRI